MPSITLYQDSAADVQMVRSLLTAAGLALDGDALPSGSPVCLNPSPAILVLLYESLTDDKIFEAAMTAAASEGRRIIGIWPKSDAAKEVPATFKKYSSDQVIWDAARVRQAICGLDQPAYDTLDGSPQVAPFTARNC